MWLVTLCSKPFELCHLCVGPQTGSNWPIPALSLLVKASPVWLDKPCHGCFPLRPSSPGNHCLQCEWGSLSTLQVSTTLQVNILIAVPGTLSITERRTLQYAAYGQGTLIQPMVICSGHFKVFQFFRMLSFFSSLSFLRSSSTIIHIIVQGANTANKTVWLIAQTTWK